MASSYSQGNGTKALAAASLSSGPARLVAAVEAYAACRDYRCAWCSCKHSSDCSISAGTWQESQDRHRVAALHGQASALHTVRISPGCGAAAGEELTGSWSSVALAWLIFSSVKVCATLQQCSLWWFCTAMQLYWLLCNCCSTVAASKCCLSCTLLLPS